MRKIRKGFTLVELLIVIAILGTLTAIMSISSGRATSSAKAATILSNIDTCKTAAAVYYSENYDNDLSEKTASEFLKEDSPYLPGWSDMSKGNIDYKVVDDAKGYSKWSITVDFSKEADSSAIKVLRTL